MTTREPEGPRPNSPGPRLEAVERLRRQLESTADRASRRAASRPRHPESGHDLFGHNSADPYASGVGTWNYGPADHPASYLPVPEDNSADAHRSTWRTTDDAPSVAEPFLSHRPEPADESLRRISNPSRRPESPDSSSPIAEPAAAEPIPPTVNRDDKLRAARAAFAEATAAVAAKGGDRGRGASGGTNREGAGPPEEEFGQGTRRGARGRSRPDSGGGSGESGVPTGGGIDAQAKDACLRLLTDRARSRAELADRLAERGFGAAVVKRVLDRLAEVGLVDDAAFAQQWVRTRHAYSGKGKKVLAEELRRKGIAPEHAEPALESVTAEDETTRAAELVRRKLQTLAPDLDRDKTIRRLVAMLARRGYNPVTAYAVVTAELPASRPHDVEAAPSPSPVQSSAASRRESPSDDADSATELVRAKLRTLPPRLDRDTATRRLVGMLARRGYNSSTAYAVVTAELAASAVFEATEQRPDRREQTGESPSPSATRRAGLAPRRGPVPIDGSGDDGSADASESGSFDDEQARAAELVRAKLRSLPRDLDREKAIRRLVGLLARRGFSTSLAYTVVKAELADAGRDGD